jgi:hypothetical protein
MEGQTASGGGGGTTTKITVKEILFDENDGCSCTLDSTTYVWEDDSSNGGGDISPSVGDVIGDGSVCYQVVALNATGSDDGYTDSNETFNDCDDCNSYYLVCEDMGEEICLLPHMLVKHIDGYLIKVIDLKLGDLIESAYGFTEVKELIKDHPRDGYYIIEDELYISDDHPILVDGKMVRAKDYKGNKKYVELSTNTVYVGTFAPTFNVYCENNVYVVDGQYKP